MQDYFQSRRRGVLAAIAAVAFCPCIFGQNAPASDAPKPDARAREARGLPPRAAPTEYQAHAQAGSITIAAEFDGHSVPDPQSALSTEDYVVVEVALFGPPEGHLQLSSQDFSLRINGKKMPLPAQGYAAVFKSLKDPTWAPPVPVEPKSKGGITTGGQSDGGGPPPVVHIPIEVERAMQQRVQKASLPEGDRMLPAAGLIFFDHRGKSNSVELIYSGPAGKATLTLQP
jgi:hypothetical protein